MFRKIVIPLFIMLYACEGGSPEKNKAVEPAPDVTWAQEEVNTAVTEPDVAAKPAPENTQGLYYDISAGAATPNGAANFTSTAPGKKETVQPAPAIGPKKVIRNGNMGVKTKDISKSKGALDQLLQKLGGYYEGEELENNDYRVQYVLKIRVPANRFDELITGVESGGDEVTSKNIVAQDVTEEYVDLQARLRSKREYMERYRSFLAKAKNVEEMLAIEQNIRQLQEEIESKEGRLRYLNDQVSYSTLSLVVHQPKDYEYKPAQADKFTERVQASLGSGWTGVVNFTVGILRVWPVLVLIGLVLFLVVRYRKKFRVNQ